MSSNPCTQSDLTAPTKKAVAFYPASLAQRRLWFLNELQAPTAAYNVDVGLWLYGPLNVKLLQACLQEIVDRHESLRTTFEFEHGELLQRITPSFRVSLPLSDFADLADAYPAAYELAKKEVGIPFDLKKGPLFRARIMRIGPEEHVLLCTMHHTVTDAWSLQIFTNELSALYEVLSRGSEPVLPGLPIQYGDYSEWQYRMLKTEKAQQKLRYWKQRLAGAPPILELPQDHPRPPEQTLEGNSQTYGVPDDLMSRVLALATQFQVTPFMFLLAAFKVLLYRYSGQTDLLVGVPVAGRTEVETEALIGFFVETIVLRDDLSGNPQFVDVLHQVRETTLDALANAEVPFEQIVEAIGPERNLSCNPIFQVMFSVIKSAIRSHTFGKVLAYPYVVNSSNSIVDLFATFIEDSDGKWFLQIQFNTALFQVERIERMFHDFAAVLRRVTTEPAVRIDEITVSGVSISGARRRENRKIREQLHRPTCSLAIESQGQDASRAKTDEELLVEIRKSVLDTKEIRTHDNFFEPGGHSLKAVSIVSGVEDLFGQRLSPASLMSAPTIQQFAPLVQSGDFDQKIPRIEHRTETGPYPLSFAQERLWFLDQLASGSPVYNIVDVIPIPGQYDANAMRMGLDELVRRHEILRTVFGYVNRQPMQTVVPRMDFELLELDLSTLSQWEREREWQCAVSKQGRAPFDLSKGPLFRTAVVHVGPQEHRLLLTIHHIIADEWSMELIHAEVTRLYDTFAQGQPRILPDLRIQYADFALWQRQWLRGDAIEKQISYWKEELSGAPYVLELPTDKPRPRVQSFRGRTQVFALPRQLLEQLTYLGTQLDATLFMVLEASFAALLHRYTGQNDILVGTPISGRTHSETENLIGCFLNTVVLRSRFRDDLTFRGLLRQMREKALGAYAHPDLPFEHVVAELAPERDPSRMPLFQVMFVLHNPDGVSAVSKVSGKHELQTETSKFDLTLMLEENDAGLAGLIEYSTDLFEAETIRRMCGHYQELLTSIAEDPDQSIFRLRLLTDSERQKQLVEWNCTVESYPDLCLHEWVAEQANRIPEQTAVIFEQQSLTYAELNERANQLAHGLQGLGVVPDMPVGLLLERSLEMVVGLLGILKSGAAYVPLDSSFPASRLAYMVEDSEMKVLVTHRGLEEMLAVKPATVVQLDSGWKEISRQSNKSQGLPKIKPTSLAYLLYTSGSTGKPKGVKIPHRAVVNFLSSMSREPGLDEGDTLLSVTTISFDIFGLEIWLPLIRGAKVVLASKEILTDGRRLAALIVRSGTTVMQATPSTWRLLLDSGWEGSRGLKVLCGGEAWSRDLAQRLLPKCASLWNMYGPTETTIWSAVSQVNEASPVVIGAPIANTQFYVVDAYLQPVPVGVPGEMLIGGDGLADGYWKRPELTAEKFITNPFTPAEGSRLYCTGDLVRYLPNGTIEFLTRMDQQVKVRGYRIELGEIESILQTHPGVKRSVVAVWEERGDKQLVAYIVSENGSDELAGVLRRFVKEKLPEYMVPGAFVMLAELPRMPNGKVNRKALPAPRQAVVGKSYVAPRTETERVLAGLWAEILGVEQVGIGDNFFELGGHSFLAARLTAQIQRMTGRTIPVSAIFRAPTIAGLARLFRDKTMGKPDPVLMQLREGEREFPLFAIVAPGVDSMGYALLARHLTDGDSMYKLQGAGTAVWERPFEKDELRSLAQQYVSAMRRVQPAGPFAFVSMCTGVLIAQEMILQLESVGEKVGLFAILDTWVQENSQIPVLWSIGYYLSRIRAFPQLPVRQQLARMRATFTRLTTRNRARSRWVEAYWPGKDFAQTQFRAPVMLFKRPKQPFYYVRDPHMGWGTRSTGGVEVCEVHCEHYEFLRQPRVQLIAQKLSARLRQVNEQAGATLLNFPKMAVADGIGSDLPAPSI